MSYNDRDYQKLAQAIVVDYCECQAPLEESVVKTADSLKMNVHEARRLVEAVNVDAHLSLFEKMSEHRYVEFDLVEPDRVCDTLFGSPPDVDGLTALQKEASDLALDLPNEHWEAVKERAAKLAADATPKIEEPTRDKFAGVKTHHALDRANKIKDGLESQLRVAHAEYAEKLAAFAHHMRFLDTMPYGDFEKDAYALHGDSALVPISQLRETLRLEGIFNKTAGIPQFVIENETHAKFAAVMTSLEQVRELGRGYQWYTKQAEPLLYA